MMMFKIVLLCALVAAPALGSAIKGYAEAPTKGARPFLSPVEQQKLIEHAPVKSIKQPAFEQAPAAAESQQREEPPAPLIEQKQAEEIPQQREEQQRLEAPPKLEEAPSKRYEAKPQLEFPAKGAAVKYEQREEKLEQQQVSQYEAGQIELREEQRRYEADSPLVQPILPLTVVEENAREQHQPIQQQLYASKGGAPLAEAEPYAFSYAVEGSSRSESGDTKGVVRGQYTLQGADGSNRIVEYVADQNGFRASVNTNELGTEAKSPANVALRTSQPSAEEITLKLEGKTKEEFAAAASKTAAAAPAFIPPPPVPAKPENWSVKGSLPLPQALAIPQAPLPLPLEETKISPPKFEAPKAPLAAAKGGRLILQQQQVEQEQFEQYSAPIKSAEQVVRAPKAIGQLKYAAALPQGGFESATAHRAVYRVPPSNVGYAAPSIVAGSPVVPVRPAGVSVVRSQGSVVRGPVPAVSRTYLQRERYPPSPVQGGYRRQGVEPVPVQGNPRVSFYSPSSSSASFDDEQPSSFEQPDS